MPAILSNTLKNALQGANKGKLFKIASRFVQEDIVLVFTLIRSIFL